MSDHRDIYTESRTLTLQATVFRALRARGLEPEVSDISATRVQPAETFPEQMFRILVERDIVAHLRSTIGLGELERDWVRTVVDAACRRHERRQRPQRQAASRRPQAVAREPMALVSTSTATTTAVVFRRRIGGDHG